MNFVDVLTGLPVKWLKSVGGAASVHMATSDLVPPEQDVVHGSFQLDMSAVNNEFIIPNTENYSHITLFATGLGVGLISVKGDLLESQTNTIVSSKIGFRTISATENHTASIVDIANNNTVQRSGLAFSALRVYVSTSDAVTGTVYYVLKGKA